MFDVERRIREIRNPQEPIIKYFTDMDFYKFTMGQLINRKFKGTKVKFALINRDPTIRLFHLKKELSEQLNHVKTLLPNRSELSYLRGTDIYDDPMFGLDYILPFKHPILPDYILYNRETSEYPRLVLEFPGPWEKVTYWETLALSILSELYYTRMLYRLSDYEIQILYNRADDKLFEKIQELKRFPDLTFSDFGTRRRNSFMWHEYVVERLLEELPNQFKGTSNTYLASKFGLNPIGTNAHEMPMAYVRLYPEHPRESQYKFTRDWFEMYGHALSIILPDTFGTPQFLEGAPPSLWWDWKGFRIDSGNPFAMAEKIIQWWRQRLDERAIKHKMLIFSDGLDLETIIRLYRRYNNICKISFGWGTKLTNDFTDCFPTMLWRDIFRTFSVVIKMVEVNGKPTIKLSDNPEKQTGDESVVKEFREIFRTPEQERIELEC